MSIATSNIQLLKDFEIIQPTFLLCMSHLWSEFYADFMLELEELTILQLTPDIINSIQTNLNNSQINMDINININKISYDIKLQALKLLDGWSEFINIASNLLGILDIKSLVVVFSFQ